MTVKARPWLSLANLATVGLVQLLVLGIVSVVLVQRTLGDRDLSRRAVVATYETLDEVNRVLELIEEVEISERGFVITGNPLFIEPYNRSRQPLRRELARLAAASPAEAELARRAQAKLSHASDVIARRAASDLTGAEATAATTRSKQLMDAVRQQFAIVIASERAGLARRMAARQEAQRRSEQLVMVTLIGAQLISFCIGLLLLFYNRQRRRAELVARQRTALLRATLENIASGIALLNANGELLESNARLQQLLGVTDGECVAAALGEQERQAAMAHKPVRLQRTVGQGVDLEVEGQAASDNLYVLTYTDISERNRVNQLKNNFVATVSHELRTPLTAIRGSLGLLAGPMSGQLPKTAVSLLAIADRNAVRLIGLVNDLLDIDKIEAGRMAMTLAPLDLNQLALEAAEANRSYAVQRRVTLAVGRTEQPAVVAGDATRLHQVITNLISNAAKFSPENGIVTVTVERSSDFARLSVHDAGSGIPLDFQSRIFGKFAQAGSGDGRRFNGSGLGLNISQAIVKHHGGVIEFQSVPGDTVFFFALPLRADVVKAGDPGQDAPALLGAGVQVISVRKVTENNILE